MEHEKQLNKLARWLIAVLRHDPQNDVVKMDSNGWVKVGVLLSSLKIAGKSLKKEQLDYIVASDSKGRFEYGKGETLIRAAQGHSFPVDYLDRRCEPPEVLFHGTATSTLGLIRTSGILPMSRSYVHLSSDIETAVKVGQRHGNPVVLSVLAKQMCEAGHSFYRAANGVWLVDSVSPEYIDWTAVVFKD